MKLYLTFTACIVAGFLVSPGTSASAAITNPTDLSGTVLWLDATDASTVIETDDPGFVAQWTDKSDAGTNHMLQSDAAKKPATGTATLGGLNALTFDGSSDYLVGSAPLADGDDDYTYFAVWRPRVDSGIHSLYEQAGPGVSARSAILVVNNKYGFNGQNNDLHSLVPFTANEWRVTAMTVDDNKPMNIHIYDNGRSDSGATSQAGSLNVGIAGATVGKKQQVDGEYLDGDVAELIAYDRVLTAAEIVKVDQYIGRKYGLGGSTTTPTPLHQWTFNGNAQDSVGGMDGTLNNGASISDGKLVLDGINDYMITGPLADAAGVAETIIEKTLIAWVSLNNLTQTAGGALTIENPNADPSLAVFDSIVFGEDEAEKWMAGSNNFYRTESPQTFGAIEDKTDPRSVMIAVVYDGAHGITIYREGMLYGQYTKGTLQTYSTANGSDVVLGVRYSAKSGNTGTPGGRDAFLAGLIDEARIYGTALSKDQIQTIMLDGPVPVPEPAATVCLFTILLGFTAICSRIRKNSDNMA